MLFLTANKKKPRCFQRPSNHIFCDICSVMGHTSWWCQFCGGYDELKTTTTREETKRKITLHIFRKIS